MEDMSESDLLPKNMIKVPEVYIFTILSIIIWRMGKGRRGKGGGGKQRGRGGEESTYLPYCHNVSLSLQSCEEELKNSEHVIYPLCILLLSYTRAGWENNIAVLCL